MAPDQGFGEDEQAIDAALERVHEAHVRYQTLAEQARQAQADWQTAWDEFAALRDKRAVQRAVSGS